MYKLFAILFIFLVAQTGRAQYKSNLTISTTGAANLKVKLGSSRYSLQDRTTTFQGLAPGDYDLVVYQWQKKADGSSDYVLVYNKSVRLTANRHTEISILRFGKVAWDEAPIAADNWGDSYNNPSPGNGTGQQNGYSRELDATQFANIQKVIVNEFSDDDKLRVAKVAIRNNLFSTAQLRMLTNAFFSDDKKLEFLKAAYDYCADKGNYITLADALFDTQKRKELVYYIGNR